MIDDPSVHTNKDNLKLALNLTCKYNKGFNICHFNARSLTIDKLDYLNNIFHESSIDVICVTETWFKSCIQSSIYAMCDFSLLRNDRSTRCRGGGIAIYFNSMLKCKVLHKSLCSYVVECMFLEFNDNVQKCLVVCVYNPHKCNDLTSTFTKISELSVNYVHVLVCGDFNVDILNNNARSKHLLSSFNSCGINIVNKYATRFAPHCKPTMLDLFGTSEVNNVNQVDQFPLAGISDHELMYLCYNIEFNKAQQITHL